MSTRTITVKKNVNTYITHIGDYIKLIKENEYDIDPDYQREYVWDNEKQNNYLESFIDNDTVDHIVLAKQNKEDKYSICDGKQRSTTLLNFFTNQIPYHEKESDNKYFFSEINSKYSKNKKYYILSEKDQKTLEQRNLTITIYKNPINIRKLYYKLNDYEPNIVDPINEEYNKIKKNLTRKFTEIFKNKFKRDDNYELEGLRIFYNLYFDEVKYSINEVNSELYSQFEHDIENFNKKSNLFIKKLKLLFDNLNDFKLTITTQVIIIHILKIHSNKLSHPDINNIFNNFYSKSKECKQFNNTRSTVNFYNALQWIQNKKISFIKKNNKIIIKINSANKEPNNLKIKMK